MSSNPSDQSKTSPPLHLAEDDGAAQTHVTSTELAKALAQIEAKQDAEAQRLAATIPIGQAIEELGLGLTPGELLAEVQKLRQAPPPPVPEFPGRQLAPETVIMPLPAPSQPGRESPLTHCPACSRKLLTQASALCNWCGAKIDDLKYQAQAAKSREQLDKTELSQLETMVQEETRYGIFGRLKRRAKDAGSKPPLG